MNNLKRYSLGKCKKNHQTRMIFIKNSLPGNILERELEIATKQNKKRGCPIRTTSGKYEKIYLFKLIIYGDEKPCL
jgi:hypothetical protein